MVEGGKRAQGNAQSELDFRFKRADNRCYNSSRQIPKQTQ